MKILLKNTTVIFLLCIFIFHSMNFGFAYAQTADEITASNKNIVGDLPKILAKADDDEMIDLTIWLKNYSPSNNPEEAKRFYNQSNGAFVKLLPEDVQVAYVSIYSPILRASAKKTDVFKIAQMDDVWEISEGSSYHAIDLPSNNSEYFNASLAVDGVEISFIENEYYRVYADFYGKYFDEEYKKNPPEKKIHEDFYQALQSKTDDQYVTVVLHEAKDSIAKLLNIPEKSVIAVCQNYPIAMIKISPKTIDSILSNAYVSAVYNSFPSATTHSIVNNAILEETFSPKSSDARKILRYAARLDQAPISQAEGKRFFFMSDANLDGKITSADARIALRIAAKLEKGKTYYKSYNGAGGFWEESYKEGEAF